MAEGKSKRWIWLVVIGLLVVVGLIIWAASSSKNAEKSADEADIKETAEDIQNPSLTQSLKDCRKACRIICKSNYRPPKWNLFGKRKTCKAKCKSDCISGVDIIANRDKY